MVLVALGFFTCCSAQSALSSAGRVQRDTVQRFSESTLIIFYEGKHSKARLLKAIRRYGANPIYVYKNFSGMAIRIPKGKTLQEAITYFQKVRGVVAVNKDYVNQLD